MFLAEQARLIVSSVQLKTTKMKIMMICFLLTLLIFNFSVNKISHSSNKEDTSSYWEAKTDSLYDVQLRILSQMDSSLNIVLRNK